MFTLQFNGLRLTEEEVLLSQVDNDVMSFCRSWMQGQQSFMLKTSGSTGAPKDIKVTRQQLKASASQTAAALSLKENDTALLCLSPAHIGGKMMLVRAMEIGMNLVVVEPSANPLKEISQPIDFCAMVPIQVATTRESNPEKFEMIRKLIIGGAPLSELDQEYLEFVSTQSYLTYGMTETVSHVALKRISEVETAYRMLPGIEYSLDERSCLVLKGEVTNNQEVITNDIVEFLSEGAFVWKGRFDNVINSGGVKVVPEIVEAKIRELLVSLGVLSSYFVFGLEDQKLGQKVTLFIEGEPKSLTKESFLTVLDRYEVPQEIKFVDHFPYTATGKVDKQRLLRAC